MTFCTDVLNNLKYFISYFTSPRLNFVYFFYSSCQSIFQFSETVLYL